MKRFVVSLIATILAFSAGLVTASSWATESKPVAPIVVNTAQPCPPNQPQLKAPVQSYSVNPPQEFDFGQNGLKLVPERVKLESNSLGYDIDVSYPQILATPNTETTNIRKVNQQIRDTTTKLYQWPMSRAEQVRQLQAKGIPNTVNFTYQIGLATDSFLSIHYIGYSYSGADTRQVQNSFAVNYDLTSGKSLKLSELFKPGSNYMKLISRYSIDALSMNARTINAAALEPTAGNFDVWQITTQGISFNFPTCKVANCSDGELIVSIPYDDLRPMLNPDIPSRFNITYP